MKHCKLSQLTEENFRRLMGVKRAIFERMVEILREDTRLKKAKGGRPTD